MLEELEVRLAETLQNKVDLCEQLVGTELRAPSLEDGVSCREDTIVDDKVVGCQAVDKILQSQLQCSTRPLTSTRVSQFSGKSIEAMVDRPSPI